MFTSNQVLIWNLGFDRKGARGIHWMYFPDPSVVFYRVGWYDNIGGLEGQAEPDPLHIRGDRMSLYVEVGAPDGAKPDLAALRARVLADLARTGIVTDHRLVAEHHVALDPAYVHITQASLAETTTLAQLARGKGGSLRRPLRRLDVLLDRGQPAPRRATLARNL